MEDAEKRQEYIARLKSAGPNSQPVLDLKKSMEGLKMKKPPKNIFEKTILQHTFKYCDPLECFLQFRLVCKDWQNAIETIKFDRFNKVCVHKYACHPTFLTKFLPMFKKIRIYISKPIFESEQVRTLLLNNVSKLNEISLSVSSEVKQFLPLFIQTFYQNSSVTVKKIYHYGKYLPDLQFPKTTVLSLMLSYHTNTTFIQTFSNAMENIENLELIQVSVSKTNDDIFKFITENFSKHYMFCSTLTERTLNHLPLKLCKCVRNLDTLRNKTYNHEMEYLSCYIGNICDPTSGCWDEYREILDQCGKLKQMSFETWEQDLNLEKWEGSNIWKEMAAYLKQRNIQILSAPEILNNFIAKAAEEAEVKCRIHFC